MRGLMYNIWVTREAPMKMRLLFVNDSLFFVNGSLFFFFFVKIHHMRVERGGNFETYGRVFGQVVNIHKMIISFSRNVGEEKQKENMEMLRMERAFGNGTYFSLSLVVER